MNDTRQRKWRRRAAAAALVMTAQGCALLPSVHASAPRAAASVPPPAPASPAPSYQDFGTPELNRLIDLALRRHPDLGAARAAVAQAEAAARAAEASRGPSLSAKAGAGAAGAPEGRGHDSFTLSSLLTWDPDFTGKNRAARDAALEDLSAAREDAKQARIELAASVASAYFAAVAARQKEEIVRRQIASAEQALAVLRAEYAAGNGSAGDVLRQKAALAGLAPEAAAAEGDKAAAAAALRALTASAFSDVAVAATLPEPKETSEGSVRADAATDRPEIHAARRRLLAACRRADSAEAARLPSFSISLNAGFGGASLTGLADAWATGIAAELLAPLLDGGARAAEAERRHAMAEERFQIYRASVLEAVRRAETALARDAQARAALRAQTERERVARAALRQIRAEYAGGGGSARDVTDALSAVQSAELQTLQAGLAAVLARTELIRAAGAPPRAPQGKEVR